MSLPTLPVTISIFFFPFIVFINSPGYLFELILFFLDWLRGVKADFFFVFPFSIFMVGILFFVFIFSFRCQFNAEDVSRCPVNVFLIYILI